MSLQCNETAPLALGTKILASEALAHEWDSKRLNQRYTSAIYASFPGMRPLVTSYPIYTATLNTCFTWESEQNNGVMETGCEHIARIANDASSRSECNVIGARLKEILLNQEITPTLQS